MNLNEQAENLIRELQNKLREVDQLEERQRHLDVFDASLRALQGRLTKEKEDLVSKVKAIDQEKEYIVKALEKTKQQEIVEAKLDGKRALLIQQMEDVKKAEADLTAHARIIEEKEKKIELLDKREEDLKRKEELLLKKELVNDERSKDLDMKEQAILQEAARLQKIAERYKIG